MKLISEIEIKGFRSIRDCRLRDLSDFTVFAGLNNSGKSNVLRALNAFFNAETDIGQPLNVDDDYFRPDLRKKKAKRISVAVTFSLPSQFRFRRGLEPVEQLLGGKEFEIKKEWSRKKLSPDYYLNSQLKEELESRQRIDQFLQLINFRYIPNRVLPIELIRREHQALRDILVRRLGRKGKDHESAFDTIRETSEKMIQALDNRFQDACPDVGKVRLATPTSWSDMVFAFGYRMGQDDVEIDDMSQGSGIQSLLMLETLYLIDRDYFQKFGWQQAAIWAVEEPESSLHTSLEARVASYLASISADPASRLQILCTTHSDLMLQYSGSAVVVENKNRQTIFDLTIDKQEALDRLSRSGVSRWAHPILHYPLDPLILVEGKYDHAFLEEAFKYFRPKKNVRLTYLEQLEGAGKTGGIDDLLRYLKNNVQAIKVRSKDSPVTVILDWDAARKKGSFERIFEENDPFKVLVWPDSTFNSNLGKSFRGIERHFSDRMIEEAERRGVPISRTRAGVCSIEKESYGNAKNILFDIVKEGLQKEDFEYAESFMEEILQIYA